MRYFILIYLFLFCLSGTALAQANYFSPADIGTAAGTIAKGNIVGFSKLSNSVFDNPAALYRVGKLSASVFATTFMEEVDYKSLSVAMRTPIGVIGLGYMSAGVVGIPKTAKHIYNSDPSGQDYDFVQIDTYSYQNTMIKAAYEWSQNKLLHWGFAATYYNTVVDTYVASGINADVGLSIDFGSLNASIVLRNIIPGLKMQYRSTTTSKKPSDNVVQDPSNQYANEVVPVNPNDSSKGYYDDYGTQTEKLPLETIYGVQYRWTDFKFLGQVHMSDTNRNLLKSFGMSYRPSLLSLVEFSGGYRDFLAGKDVKSSITVGLGLNLAGINFDYAYETSSHPQYNGKHYFSLGLSL